MFRFFLIIFSISFIVSGSTLSSNVSYDVDNYTQNSIDSGNNDEFGMLPVNEGGLKDSPVKEDVNVGLKEDDQVSGIVLKDSTFVQNFNDGCQRNVNRDELKDFGSKKCENDLPDISEQCSKIDLENLKRVRNDDLESQKINCIEAPYSNDEGDFNVYDKNFENNDVEVCADSSGLIAVNDISKNSDNFVDSNVNFVDIDSKKGSEKKENKGVFERFCDRHVEYCEGIGNFFSQIFQFQFNLHLFSYKFLILDTFFLHVYPEITNLNLFIWKKNWIEDFIKEVMVDVNILIQFNYMFFMGMKLIIFKEKDLFFRLNVFRFGPIFRLLIGRVFINSGFEFDWKKNIRKFEKKWKFYFSIGYKMYYDAAIYPCFKFK